MIQLFILFLIRKRLGLKKFEMFQYANQRDKEVWYYIGPSRIMKVYPDPDIQNLTHSVQSNVSLNWLLDDRCKIIKKEV